MTMLGKSAKAEFKNIFSLFMKLIKIQSTKQNALMTRGTIFKKNLIVHGVIKYNVFTPYKL